MPVVIGSNWWNGIYADAPRTVVTNAYIGVTPNGIPVPNAKSGIMVLQNAVNSLIGQRADVGVASFFASDRSEREKRHGRAFGASERGAV